MLKFKNKDGKVVMTEDTQTGEINILSEELKDLKIELEEDSDNEQEAKGTETEEK